MTVHQQIALPGIDPAMSAPIGGAIAPVEPDSTAEFDWFTEEAVIVERQQSIAVYRNPRDHVVIRAEGDGYGEEDKFIFVSTREALQRLIGALERELKAWREA